MKFPKVNHYLLIIFLILSISSYGQESVLKLNKEKNYKIFFVDISNPSNTNYRIDSIKNFFIVKWDNRESFRIEDKNTLEALSQSWIAKKTEELQFCWHDYFAYVVENEKIVDELRISEKCKQVVRYNGVYKYADPILTSLDKSNTISVAWLDFKSVSFGRTLSHDAKTRAGIFMPEVPNNEWLTYDGKLTISVENGEDTLKTAELLTREIQHKFPQDSFKLKSPDSGPGYQLYTIYCKKELEEKLSDFNVTSKWEELHPGTITLFSSSEKLIQDLVKKYASLND